MFKFTKSTNDLGKLAEPIQHKILCDWLRTIKNTCDRIDRSNKVIQLDVAKLYDLLDQSSSPSGEPVIHPDDDSTSPESVY